MKVLSSQLSDVVAAVTVTLPLEFTWFDRPGPVPTDAVAASLTSEQSRQFLVESLQHHLYSHFYCTGGVTVAREQPAGPSRADELVDELSAANSGVGAWQDGWRLLARLDEGSVIASRDSLAVRAESGWWRLSESSPDGTLLALRMGKEARARQPNYYIALSDAYFDTSTQPLVRTYWNVGLNGSAQLVRLVTALLNGIGIPFGLKLVNEPASFDRCDAGVLYLHQRDWPVASPQLSRIHAALGNMLHSPTPPFARRLAPGLGLAEDPPSGDSFGMSRCAVVSDALIRSAEVGTTSHQERLDLILQRLRGAGINVERPHLNPGSAQDYPFTQVQPLHLKSRARLEPTPEHDADDQAERAGFQSTAVDIAERLVRDAVWHDQRCTWIGPDLVAPAGGGTAAPSSWASLSSSVYSGTAGVALFLARVAAEVNHPEASTAACGAARHALHHAAQLSPRDLLGLYTGGLGVAAATTQVAKLLGRTDLVPDAVALAIRCFEQRPHSRERDLLGGDAGGIVASLLLAELLGDQAWVDRAAILGEELLVAGHRHADALWWPPSYEVAGPALTGLSHGAAGAVWALLQLDARQPDARWRAAAEAAARFERRWFDPEAGNWRDLRGLPGTGEFMTAWCHGAPGTALSRFGVSKPLAGEAWLREARHGVATTRSMVEAALTQQVNDFSLCHGLSGNADVLLEVGRQNGDAGLEKLARAVGRRGLESYGRPHRPWPCGTRAGETPSLMLGLAGIGFFYLRLASESVPSPLLLLPAQASADEGDPANAPRGGTSSEPPGSAAVGWHASSRRSRSSRSLVIPATVSTGAPSTVTLCTEDLRALVRTSLLASGFSIDGERAGETQASRWATGRMLRDQFLPAQLPAFADLLDYLALPEVDAHLWNSLPFMLAFGAQQATALLAHDEPEPTETTDLSSANSATLCALFSGLLSVFDHAVDETERREEVFELEPSGVAALCGDRDAHAKLGEAYQRTDDARVRLICVLFSVLGAHLGDLLEAIPGEARGPLQETVRRLFEAERVSTLKQANTLRELESLADDSRDKSVLPFVTLVRLAALGAGCSEPAPRALAAAEAAGRAICQADDLVDLLTDLSREAPSPLAVSVRRTALLSRAPVSDTMILDAVEPAVHALLKALNDPALTTGQTVDFTRQAVARWVGWGEEVEPPLDAAGAAEALPLLTSVLAGEAVDHDTFRGLLPALDQLGESALARRLHSRFRAAETMGRPARDVKRPTC